VFKITTCTGVASQSGNIQKALIMRGLAEIRHVGTLIANKGSLMKENVKSSNYR
jgi:hypothetical protein